MYVCTPRIRHPVHLHFVRLFIPLIGIFSLFFLYIRLYKLAFYLFWPLFVSSYFPSCHTIMTFLPCDAGHRRVRSTPPLHIIFSFLLLFSSALTTVYSQDTAAGETAATSPLSHLPAVAARAAAAATGAATTTARNAAQDSHREVSEAVRMLAAELENEMKKKEGFNTQNMKKEEKWDFVTGEKQEQIREALVLLTQGIRRKQIFV